jgi:hypothetical protein
MKEIKKVKIKLSPYDVILISSFFDVYIDNEKNNVVLINSINRFQKQVKNKLTDEQLDFVQFEIDLNKLINK